MSDHHELLEHAENGNYYPQGKFISREEAHKHAKSLGLEKHEYTIDSRDHTSHDKNTRHAQHAEDTLAKLGAGEKHKGTV